MFRRYHSGADNLQLYLSQAVLPPMPHGPSAPAMPPPGHKAHRNHIAVKPERYRNRFTKILAPKDGAMCDEAVKKFTESLPSESLNQPNKDDKTGFAFTLPARGFKILPIEPVYPSTIQDVAFWVTTFPLQSMTRALHVALPATREWDVMHDDGKDQDTALWNVMVWRKIPPPPDPEKPWLQQTAGPMEECSVVFVVQPPWVMTPHDFKSFMRCSSIPFYNARRRNRPFTSAERVWAKLWDTCVRKKCHHWVISSYEGWVFGAFSEGYTAAQVLGYKPYDARSPTIVECLVHHVATSMGLVNERLPQYRETTWDLEQEIRLPPVSWIKDVEFPDSGSEWDGMDEEPGISAGVSASGSVILSAWGGSESGVRSIAVTRAAQRRLAAEVDMWQDQTEDDPPPYERELSPALSESALSAAGIYDAAARGDGLPKVKILSRGEERAFGGFLTTVVEQGPVEEDY